MEDLIEEIEKARSLKGPLEVAYFGSSPGGARKVVGVELVLSVEHFKGRAVHLRYLSFDVDNRPQILIH